MLTVSGPPVPAQVIPRCIAQCAGGLDQGGGIGWVPDQVLYTAARRMEEQVALVCWVKYTHTGSGKQLISFDTPLLCYVRVRLADLGWAVRVSSRAVTMMAWTSENACGPTCSINAT